MIRFKCACGKEYKLDDKLAGRKAKCKECGAAVVVPNPSVDGLEVELPEPTPQPQPIPQPVQVSVESADKTRGRQNLKSGFAGSMGCVLGAFAGVALLGCLTVGGCFLLFCGGEAVQNAREAAREARQSETNGQGNGQKPQQQLTVDALPVLSSKYFGFYLGEAIDLQRLPSFKLWPYNKPKGAETVMRRASGTIDVQSVKSVNLECFEGRLCELIVFMKDDSRTVHETLVEQLIKKYGEPANKNMFGGTTWNATDSGQPVEIFINDGIMSNYIAYRYLPLQKLAEAKAKEKLTSGVSDQL